jgi:hypothetical protein
VGSIHISVTPEVCVTWTDVPAGDAAHEGPVGGVSAATATDEVGEGVDEEPAAPDCGDPDEGWAVAGDVAPSVPEPLAVGAPHPVTATSRQPITTARPELRLTRGPWRTHV